MPPPFYFYVRILSLSNYAYIFGILVTEAIRLLQLRWLCILEAGLPRHSWHITWLLTPESYMHRLHFQVRRTSHLPGCCHLMRLPGWHQALGLGRYYWHQPNKFGKKPPNLQYQRTAHILHM